MSGPGEARGVRQARRWARLGRLHADSVAVVAGLDAAASRLLYWYGRDLDASAELDDVVQILALAQLQAAREGVASEERAFHLAVQRAVRREVWRVRRERRGSRHAEWREELIYTQQAPDDDLVTIEELGWDDIVRVLRWRDGLALWLWAVEEWSLEAIAALHGRTKQQVWRRVRQGLKTLRRTLASV